jgi:hypothetical protein|nr:MAG TPA: LEUCINE-RICH REPEAT-CONTAINING G-PROTEIN COUPLED RECEPTOR PROTEIN, WNT, LGR, RSPO [Caudoviricetes sp.]
MHITKLLKVINGQRKKQYTALYGEMTLEWNSTSSVSFRLNSLLGNELYIDWDDDSLQEEEHFETTGSLQTLSHSYSNSRERSVKVRGSGIYVMSSLYITDRSDFKAFPLTAEKCTKLPNLQIINFSKCYYFSWTETPDWALVPKLINFNMQYCSAMRDFPFEGTETRPYNLQILDLYQSGLSSLMITDYEKLTTINLQNMNAGPLYDVNLSGCSNLKEIQFDECEHVSGINLNQCHSLASCDFTRLYKAKEIHLENCSSLIAPYFYRLGRNLPDDAEKYCTITWNNNIALSGVNFEDSYQTLESFPSPEAAPNIVSAYLYRPYAMSGDMDISQYTNLSTFIMRGASHVKNFISQGNRKIYNIECYQNYELERINIQNCPSLYKVYAYQDYNNNKLEYFTLKNCANLNEANFESATLDYGFELMQCPKLSILYLSYLRAANVTVEDLPKLGELYVRGNGDVSYLAKLNVKNCPNLYRINVRDNRYSLTDIIVESCPRTDLSIDLGYDYSITNLQLSGLGMNQSRMNDVLNYVYNYSPNNAGYITFANNINNYVPSESYVTQLVNKGWTIDF